MDDDRALDRERDAGGPTLVLEEGLVLARKYRLVRPAGFGGMAQLWVARNEATAAEVCVKVLVPSGSDDESVQRFRREAFAGARLSHRAIVRVFDLVELGPDGDLAGKSKPAALAIVMELLHGETLGDRLMTKGKLSVDEALDVAIPVVSALAHAHRAGVVHRDVKPDNIFLARDPDGHETPKVLDFGVSKLNVPDARTLTFDGVMLGTPSFMSPEQARGARTVDARSDVFSVAIVLYLMIAGKNPFEDESFHSVVSAILERQPARLEGVSDEIWSVLERALEKDPAARYADATELGIALRRAAGRTTSTDSQMGIPVRLPFDSAATVPPVGSESVAPPADGEDDEAEAVPGLPARRPTAAIVVGAIALAGAIAAVALLRGPSARGEAEQASGASAAVAPPPSAPAPQAPATTAAPVAKASPAVTADAGAPSVEPAVTKPSPSTKREPPPTATAAPPTTTAAPRATSRRDPGPPASASPAPVATEIARDPGF